MTREYTIDIVKYIEKMVRTALPVNAVNTTVPMEQKAIAVQLDELQKLAQTCEGVSVLVLSRVI
jgi:shikimate 5-dehydrogenase